MGDVYQRAIANGLRVMVYEGDVDACGLQVTKKHLLLTPKLINGMVAFLDKQRGRCICPSLRGCKELLVFLFCCSCAFICGVIQLGYPAQSDSAMAPMDIGRRTVNGRLRHGLDPGGSFRLRQRFGPLGSSKSARSGAGYAYGIHIKPRTAALQAIGHGTRPAVC